MPTPAASFFFSLNVAVGTRATNPLALILWLMAWARAYKQGLARPSPRAANPIVSRQSIAHDPARQNKQESEPNPEPECNAFGILWPDFRTHQPRTLAARRTQTLAS
jgi:hypothetical protein